MKTITKTDIFEFKEKNSSYGERIEFIIEKKGISKNWLAEELGISRQALNYLLKHSSKPKFIDEISEILKINVSWLEFGNGSPFETNQFDDEKIKIPILTEETIHLFLENQVTELQSKDYIYIIQAKNKNIIAFKLNNDSLFPPFLDGSILIFDTSITAKNKDYVLIKHKDTYLVRQFIAEGDNYFYQPKNDKYNVIRNENIDIKGVLIEARYLP